MTVTVYYVEFKTSNFYLKPLDVSLNLLNVYLALISLVGTTDIKINAATVD